MRLLLLATALFAAALARGDDAPAPQDSVRQEPAPPDAPRSGSPLIEPRGAAERRPSAGGADANEDPFAGLFQGEGSGGSALGMAFTILGYVVIFGGLAFAAYYLVKRGLIRKPFSKGEGRLRIAESRMLGNRQFLMVVEYDDQKILLGVGPGKIDYLTSLQGVPSGFPPVAPEAAEDVAPHAK